MSTAADPARSLRPSTRRQVLGGTVGVTAVLALLVTAGAGSAAAAAAPVGLGTAASFAVLAGSTVTNTGPSMISGDVGVDPGSAITGFPPAIVTGGTLHATDAVAKQAQADTVIAYDDAAGRASTADVATELGGRTLTAGVYTGPDLGITGALTLDAQGDPNAVFVFRSADTLITASASAVDLVNGASACNVFWQVSSSATLGPGSAFVGTVDALTSISAQTGATVQGRLLARNAAVTLDTNVITAPRCAAGSPTSAPASSPTTTPGTRTTPGTPAAVGTPITVQDLGATLTPAVPTAPTAAVGTPSPGAATSTSPSGGAGTGGGTTGSGTGTGSGTASRSLAATGASVTWPAAVGVLAVGVGAALVAGSRRPRGEHSR